MKKYFIIIACIAVAAYALAQTGRDSEVKSIYEGFGIVFKTYPTGGSADTTSAKVTHDGKLQVDTVDELTAAAGVTVDGVTLKDNKIETAGAVSGGAGGVITDNSITADDLAANSVDSSEIAPNAVQSSEIDTGAVTNIKLGTNLDAANFADGTVSNTEFQHLDGVSADIQGQLDAKVNDTGAESIGGTKTFTTGIVLGTGNATLNFYHSEENNAVATTGLSGSPTVNWEFHRIGNVVFATNTSTVLGTKSGAGKLTWVNAAPTDFRPPSTKDMIDVGTVNNTEDTRRFKVTSAGTIEMFNTVNAGSIPDSTTNVGLDQEITLTWTID